MAVNWMREVTTTLTGTSTGVPFAIKAYALWLRYCLGFTNPTQSVSSGDYWSVEKSGVNGDVNLTGSDKDFRDTTASSFVSGDTGKWLLLVDPNNPLNPGLYQVTYVSATTVTLDFRSGLTEYPTQVSSSNLNWYLLAGDYQVPTTSGDYFRLRTPHAYGWEIEMKYSTTTTPNGKRIDVRVAIDANWSGSKILGPRYFGSYDSKTNWFYATAERDGSFAYFMNHQSTDNRHNGVFVSHITTYESGRTDEEKIALHGCVGTAASSYDAATCVRSTDNNKWGCGAHWYSDYGFQEYTYMMESTYAGYANGLTVWTSREKNARRSSGGDDREDLLTGTQVVCDYNNASNRFRIYGLLQGHYSIRENMTSRTAFNDSGSSKDKFKWAGGMAFEWPGITPQH